MPTPDQTHNILDIDHFAAIITQWHLTSIDTLKHLLLIPEGTEVTLDETSPQTLTGDLLKGFLMGIEVSLMEIDKLPFYSNADTQTH
jgi:hypothetical protein